MARRLFPALRARPEVKSLAARVRSMSVRYSVAGHPYQSDWSVERAIREGFLSNPWIFRGVEVIADTGLNRRIVMRQGDPDTGPEITIAQDPTRALLRLNRRSSPWETSAMMRFRLYAQAVLSKKGVFLEIVRSRSGAIAMITLLDPDLTDAVPSKTNPIAAFQIRNTGDTGGVIDTLPPFDPENPEQTNSVLWIRRPHPTRLVDGISPIEPLGLSIDLDRYARLYNRDYMQSGGRPGGIVMLKGIVDDETVERIEARFNGQVRPGEITALQAELMDYQDFSTAPRDMQWSEVSDRMRKEASMGLGVPESLMGDASGRTFDNADAEYAIYLERRWAPWIAMIDDQLDVLTGSQVDDAWLRHDLSKEWVLGRHRRAAEDRAVADFNAGIATIDDVRAVKGQDPLDVPASRVLWVPAGRLAVSLPATPGAPLGPDREQDAALAAAAPMGGQPQPADPGAAAQAGAQQGAEIANYNAQTNAGAARLRLASGAGGFGGPLALEQRDALAGDAPPAPAAPELEGKQSRARADRADRSAPRWR